MRPGIVTYNIAKDWDLEAIIKNCAAVGIRGLELRTTHAHKVEPALSAAERQEVKKRFADSPVDLASLGTVCEFHSPDPAVVRQNIEEAKRFMVLAHDVGAEGIKVRPNGLPKEAEGGAARERTLEQIGKAFRECAEFGLGYGIKVCMEVHGAGTSLLPNMRRILDHANHENAWVTWNSNDTDLAGGGLEKNFSLVRGKIGFVHLRDLFLDYPFRRLFKLLKESGYDGYCCAEIPESADPLRVLRYFKALFEELARV
jgi:sugar phosphate isomerase/epimerase